MDMAVGGGFISESSKDGEETGSSEGEGSNKGGVAACKGVPILGI